jgi:TatD DNase family protein
MPSLIDSHCHIAGSEFESDLQDVVARARTSGVSSALVILAADDEAELERAKVVSRHWPESRFAIGIHPHAAGAFADDPAAAARRVDAALAAEPAARGLGEIGLDYHYDFAPRDVQQAVLSAQLRLATERDLPVIIHTREADDDTFRILREATPPRGGVLHCFTGDRDAARRGLDLGYYISLSGIVTFPRALELKEVAKLVPLDRLLVETDSPFLAPPPHRGKRNEPSHVTRVAEVIAGLRQLTMDDIADATSRNFARLFNP